MEEQRNSWRSRGIHGGAEEFMEEQRNLILFN
jgi:hypothetical protein